MAALLRRAWLRRGALAHLLLPAAALFGALAASRRFAYARHWLDIYRAPVPVVVIGNVVAGGAGKTPVVMAVVRHLRARGLQVGVVSRGFGRATNDCREVHADSAAADVGDEPLLIARSCRVPVFVAARRADAVRALLGAYPATQVIVSDDGLQHLALARDIEVCVFDERGAGNGWLLPAGPLREPWPRRADLVLRPAAARGIAGHAIGRRLATQAIDASGARVELVALGGKPFIALAGLARPEAFFEMLHERGLRPQQAIALPDHADFAVVLPRLPDDATLVCTEKDAVKLWRARPDAWAVPLEVQIDAAFWREFDSLLDAKLSSAHGSETA